MTPEEFVAMVVGRVESPEEMALQRAQKGLAWLRESGPLIGFHVENIDQETLRLSSSCRCVMGQLGGSYSLGIDVAAKHLGLSSRTEKTLWAAQHGFLADWPVILLADWPVILEIPSRAFESSEVKYCHLDAAWRQVLAEDRALHQGAA